MYEMMSGEKKITNAIILSFFRQVFACLCFNIIIWCTLYVHIRYCVATIMGCSYFFAINTTFQLSPQLLATTKNKIWKIQISTLLLYVQSKRNKFEIIIDFDQIQFHHKTNALTQCNKIRFWSTTTSHWIYSLTFNIKHASNGNK